MKKSIKTTKSNNKSKEKDDNYHPTAEKEQRQRSYQRNYRQLISADKKLSIKNIDTKNRS